MSALIHTVEILHKSFKTRFLRTYIKVITLYSVMYFTNPDYCLVIGPSQIFNTITLLGVAVSFSIYLIEFSALCDNDVGISLLVGWVLSYFVNSIHSP